MRKETIRKPFKKTSIKGKELFLYGKLLNKQVAQGYCGLHKCYLAPNDLYEKKCKKKKCKYLEEI